VRSTFHDFNCHIGGVLEIFGEPDGREMSPTKFLYEYISVTQNLADMTGMIAEYNGQYPPVL
jgi:hypothetical protein